MTRKTQRNRTRTATRRAGLAFVAPYLVLLLAFGIAPAGDAIYEAFINERTQSHGAGLQNFRFVLHDFRFWPAVQNVGMFMIIWIPVMIVGTIALALLLHEKVGKFSTTMRLVYFLPGAVTGSAAVLLWYFMLAPELSPFRPALSILGFHHFAQVFSTGHLPWVFALMAFATGSGGWIVILYGAFQAIPLEVVEAARADGAGSIRLALSIKLPLIRKYVIYLFILSFAAATQIFAEPSLIHSIEPTVGSSWWSLNQLGLTFAFDNADFGSAAVVSVMLFLLSSLAALVLVFGTDFFQTEVDES